MRSLQEAAPKPGADLGERGLHDAADLDGRVQPGKVRELILSAKHPQELGLVDELDRGPSILQLPEPDEVPRHAALRSEVAQRRPGDQQRGGGAGRGHIVSSATEDPFPGLGSGHGDQTSCEGYFFPEIETSFSIASRFDKGFEHRRAQQALRRKFGKAHCTIQSGLDPSPFFGAGD